MERLRQLFPLKMYVVQGEYVAEAQIDELIELTGKFRIGLGFTWNEERFKSLNAMVERMLSSLKKRFSVEITPHHVVWNRVIVLVHGKYHKLGDLLPSNVRRDPTKFTLPTEPLDLPTHEHTVEILKKPENCIAFGNGGSEANGRKRTAALMSSHLPQALKDMDRFMTIFIHHFKTRDVSEILDKIRDMTPEQLTSLTDADPIHVTSIYKRLRIF